MQLMKVVPRTKGPIFAEIWGPWSPESSILGGMTAVGCHMLVSCACMRGLS